MTTVKSIRPAQGLQLTQLAAFLLGLILAVQFLIVFPATVAAAPEDETNSTIDAGDLPDSGPGQGVGNYATLLEDNGASHIISPAGTPGRVWLGDSVDTEADGRPTTFADGDNLWLNDDEDGVTPLGYWGPATNALMQAEVSATSGGSGIALLAGWIDWDGNGLFAADEFYTWTVDSGVNLLNLYIAADYQPGSDLYARFRLFGMDDLPAGGVDLNNFGGQVSNGEVEDYMWQLTAPTAVTLSGAEARQSTTDGIARFGLILALALLSHFAWRRWIGSA